MPFNLSLHHPLSQLTQSHSLTSVSTRNLYLQVLSIWLWRSQFDPTSHTHWILKLFSHCTMWISWFEEIKSFFKLWFWKFLLNLRCIRFLTLSIYNIVNAFQESLVFYLLIFLVNNLHSISIDLYYKNNLSAFYLEYGTSFIIICSSYYLFIPFQQSSVSIRPSWSLLFQHSITWVLFCINSELFSLFVFPFVPALSLFSNKILISHWSAEE